MASSEPLEVYLTDHLAGAAAGLDLVETLRSNNEGTPLAAALDGLQVDIAADRDTLARIIEELEMNASGAKQAVGKVMESLSRFRLSDRVTGNPDVSRLMELEALSLGVEGKRCLWLALDAVSDDHPALASFDLGGLAARAALQRQVIEPHRVEAAAQAFAG